MQPKAQYRLVRRNYKSLIQLKEEKARAARVVELRASGLTVKAVAAALGVSERTVYNDSEEARRAADLKLKRLVRELNAEEVARVTSHLNGLSLEGQVAWIMEHSAQAKKAPRRRRVCRKLLVTVDADAAAKGHLALMLRPRSAALVPPCVVNFRLILDGKSRVVGQISIGEI